MFVPERIGRYAVRRLLGVGFQKVVEVFVIDEAEQRPHRGAEAWRTGWDADLDIYCGPGLLRGDVRGRAQQWQPEEISCAFFGRS
jgi:hypothetical protein